MNISKEAIEAGARAIYDVRDDPYDDDEWEEMDSTDREECMCQARAALTAAAPYIQAAALRDAAEYAVANIAIWDGNATLTDVSTEASYEDTASWLRARADQLEKGQS